MISKATKVETGEAKIFVRRAGKGQSLLLLHGFPQTHLMWRSIAPLLIKNFEVVCADLRGYGRSSCPPSTPNHAPYSKRALAQDMVGVMERLGFSRFSVAGHDRGGRVAYRLALDHPGRVKRLAVLDVVPTAMAWDRAGADFARLVPILHAQHQDLVSHWRIATFISPCCAALRSRSAAKIPCYGAAGDKAMNEIYRDVIARDRIEAGFPELARDVNSASAITANAWMFFMALIAYFFIALAGITHRDLLLATPVRPPLLEVDIGLAAFFIFGPLLLLLIHFALLLLHAMLAHKVLDLHSRLARFEGARDFRTHRVRIQLHCYFYSQLIAGPLRSKLFDNFLSLMTWGSLVVLPVALLLYFQVTFLPFHDLAVTWAHRIYLLADLALIAIFGVCMRYPDLSFVRGFGANIARRPWGLAASAVLSLGAIFFAVAVATIPDEAMDRVMSAIPGSRTTVPIGETDRARQRVAFWPTAVLFEGEVDFLSGRRASVFSRNLVVTDTDLVRDSETGPDETSISLRRRDLRYGTFARSDLHQADLTGALLMKACLRETNLIDAKLAKANLRGADLWRAQFINENSTGRPAKGADLHDADLRQADLRLTNLQGTNMAGALMAGADMDETLLDTQDAEVARKQGARF